KFISEYTEVDGKIIWQGLQPDILGEYFILKYINDELDDEPTYGLTNIGKLIKISRELDLAQTCHTFFLIWSDFTLDMRFTGSHLIYVLQTQLLSESKVEVNR